MDNRELHPLEYISVVKRRKWWLIAPIAASLAIGLLLARFLPKEYTSSATLAVTAPAVSTNLVGQSASFDNQERVRAISQQLLSASILSRVVTAEGLDGGDAANQAPAIARLRRSIAVSVPDPVANTNKPQALDSVVLSYSDGEADRAQRIANRLATVFVDENSRSRTEQAVGTSAFLSTELEASQARLDDLEARLRSAKEAHMGSLPEQTESNLQTLAGLRQQLEANATALSSEQDRLSLIERQIDAYTNGNGETPTIAGEPAVMPSREAAVAALQRQLDTARATYTDRHPEVQRLKEALTAAQQAADDERAASADERLATLRLDPVYRRLAGDQQTSNLRVRDLRRASDDIQRQIRVYQARVEAAPRVEQELVSLQRDYDLERQQYTELASKQRAAEMAETVARNRGGEQFAVLYPASFPAEPTRPVPLRVLLISILAGCCVGGSLMLGREYLDDSVHDARELSDELGLPVLGTIPRITA